MRKRLGVVGGRLKQHNVFCFERAELKKATEETIAVTHCPASVHICTPGSEKARAEHIRTWNHRTSKICLSHPNEPLHTLDRTIKTLSSLEFVIPHGLEQCERLEQVCGHCIGKVWHSQPAGDTATCLGTAARLLCNVWWDSHSSFFQHKTPQQGIRWWSWQKAPHQHWQLLNFQLLFSHKLQVQKKMKCNLRKLSAVYYYVHFHDRCEINSGLLFLSCLSLNFETLNSSLKVNSLFVARVLNDIWSSFTLWDNICPSTN